MNYTNIVSTVEIGKNVGTLVKTVDMDGDFVTSVLTYLHHTFSDVVVTVVSVYIGDGARSLHTYENGELVLVQQEMEGHDTVTVWEEEVEEDDCDEE